MLSLYSFGISMQKTEIIISLSGKMFEHRNLTIRASLAPRDALFLLKVKRSNTQIQITT